MTEIGRIYLDDIAARFEEWKKLAEDAAAQLSDAQLHERPDPLSNSVAIILWHLAGNLRSRWRDFLTTDGEKPDRDRDAEFEVGPDRSRREIMDFWDAAWDIQRRELAALRPEDLTRTVMIRGKPTLVLPAIDRQLAHLANHVGQILYLAKHFRGAEWRTPTVPRGQSREFNERLGYRV